MRKARPLYVVLLVACLVGLIALPLAVENRYMMHVLVLTCMYTALALSYDLLVGHLGLLSLAHPTFFGVGAYVAGILSTRFGTPFLANFVLAGIIAAGFALLLGVPFFRLAGRSFAIGTLGLGLIVQLVANNEIWLTNGPMCITGVPRPRLTLTPLLDWQVTLPGEYYYLMFGILLMVVALCSRLTTFRVGRTLMAIRDDETLAMASGVNPLKYKMFAFIMAALIAGSVGAFYVHYSTLICPSELAKQMTTVLLIILFVGGVGSMRGVIMGGVLFTFLPEFLRIAYELRMVIYGALLLVIIVCMPEGLDGRATDWLRKRRFSGTRANSGEGE